MNFYPVYKLKLLIFFVLFGITPLFAARDTISAEGADTLVYGNAEDSLVTAEETYNITIFPEKNVIGNADALRQFFELLKLSLDSSGKAVSIYHIGDSHIAGKSYPNAVAKYVHQLYGDGQTTIVAPKPKPRRVKTMRGKNVKHSHSVRKRKSKKYKQVTGSKTSSRNRKAVSFGSPELTESIQYCEAIRTRSEITLTLSHAKTRRSQRLDFEDVKGISLQGIKERNCLILGKKGICNYSAFGVPGKSYKYFTESAIALGHLERFKPNLVIISLGVNDIFGKRYDEEYIESNMERLVSIVREKDSSVSILLAITGDANFKKNKSNPFLPLLSEQMIAFAVKHNCAYWNPVPVFGGYGYMNKWYAEKLCIRDRVHLTSSGYSLLGRTLVEAINKAFILSY